MAKTQCEYAEENLIGEKFSIAQINYNGAYSSVAAGATATFNINIEIPNFKPIGFAGYGVYSEKFAVKRCSISKDLKTATLVVQNIYTEAVTPYLAYAQISYVKTT